MASPNLITPLNITGNTTQEQREMLQKVLAEAVSAASRTAMEKLDRHSAQLVLEKRERIKTEFHRAVIDIVQRHTTSDRYRDEETASDCEYPPTFRIRPVEAQVTSLLKTFPSLRTCMERLGRRSLPSGAEAWFAIPRWEALAGSYNEALELVLGALGKQRKFANRVQGRLGSSFLRPTERSLQALSIVSGQQENKDILVIAAQLGRLHRGCSARRARVLQLGNEFGLGAFAFGCILLTHPERLASVDCLMVDCGGDDYSLGGDGIFDRIPLFEYDLGGLQFSVFYNDRSRDHWGSPSGFLFEM